jgi:phosphoserine phosphatase
MTLFSSMSRAPANLINPYCRESAALPQSAESPVWKNPANRAGPGDQLKARNTPDATPAPGSEGCLLDLLLEVNMHDYKIHNSVSSVIYDAPNIGQSKRIIPGRRMTYVATLVCNPASPVLTTEMLRRASETLSRPATPQWLDPEIAADIVFEPEPGGDARAITGKLRSALASAAVDVIVQTRAGRRKKLLLADMDSTMIGQECLDELADQIGKRDYIAAITRRAMEGQIAFEPALRERVALLKGLSRAMILDVLAKRITLTPGGRVLVQTMRANGAYTVLVSGGFTLFTSVIAERLGFHEHRANELFFGEDARLSGLVAEPVLCKDAKLAALKQFGEKLGLSRKETLAVGDGANDLPMLEAAGLGVAFRAKPKVAAAARARIDYADLSALLYAQGYSRREFIMDPAIPADSAQA